MRPGNFICYRKPHPEPSHYEGVRILSFPSFPTHQFCCFRNSRIKTWPHTSHWPYEKYQIPWEVCHSILQWQLGVNGIQHRCQLEGVHSWVRPPYWKIEDSLLSFIASIHRATVTWPAPSQQMSWCNKKNEGGISRARLNPVSWITNPNSHTPVSNSISYFKRGCLVILFKLYNRPQRLLLTLLLRFSSGGKFCWIPKGFGISSL